MLFEYGCCYGCLKQAPTFMGFNSKIKCLILSTSETLAYIDRYFDVNCVNISKIVIIVIWISISIKTNYVIIQY